MRFMGGGVRDYIFYSKSITGFVVALKSSEVQRSAFARFLGLFDFGLLQQYLPTGDVARCRRVTAHE